MGEWMRWRLSPGCVYPAWLPLCRWLKVDACIVVVVVVVNALLPPRITSAIVTVTVTVTVDIIYIPYDCHLALLLRVSPRHCPPSPFSQFSFPPLSIVRSNTKGQNCARLVPSFVALQIPAQHIHIRHW